MSDFIDIVLRAVCVLSAFVMAVGISAVVYLVADWLQGPSDAPPGT